MNTLHLIRTSGFETTHFASALRVVSAHDAIVLLDDGCYNVHHTLMTDELIQTLTLNNAVYIINTHSKARAITNTAQYNVIEISTVVDLCMQYNKVITWQ